MNNRGFTLLEMLVALAIFSLVVVTLLRLDIFALRATAALDSHSVARIVAQNQAVLVLSDPQAPPIGRTQSRATNAGRQWQITQTVRATSDPVLVRVGILVTSSTGPAQARLTFVRAVL